MAPRARTRRFGRDLEPGADPGSGATGGSGTGSGRPAGPADRRRREGQTSPARASDGPNGPNGGRRGNGGNGGGDDGGAESGGDGEAPPQRHRRLPAWVVPVLLGLAGLAAVAGALALNGDTTAAALDAPAPTTPVLSARRAPELVAAPVADRRLAADLDSWIAQSPSNSCLVVEASEDTLFAHNPTLPLAGASTQKLVTATALLLARDPDDHLETVVGAAAPPAAGIVAGDLYVVGGGDPLLATPAYASTLNGNHGGFLTVDPAQLADAIVAAGVTRIEGSIVGDDSRYDSERYNPAWPSRYRSQAVVGPVSALNINDGFGFYFDDGAGPGGGRTLDPPTNAAAVLTQLLRQRGVAVGGEAHAGQAPEGLAAIATFPSRTVRELVAEMLTDSDNDTAEMALKEIGATTSGSGTWAAGTAAVTSLLSEAGVDVQGTNIVDGSGLSDTDRLNCQLLVDLLTRPETGPVLVEGLAVAGESGTLVDRWDETPVEGRLRAKTGTLNTVTALAGRVDPLQGGTLSFAYVLNVAAPVTITAADVQRQEGLADILVNYPRGVDVAALVPASPAPE